MKVEFPFDPIERAKEAERIVMRGEERLYYRFRGAPYYGGIATADAIGCTFLCAYCWNYGRNLNPERYGRFYSPQQVASELLKIAKKRLFKLFRITGSEPILGEPSLKHVTEVVRIIFENKPDSRFILETNGFALGIKEDLVKYLKYPNLLVRVAIKGTDEDSFELVTGAKKEFFIYPIRALRKLQEENIRAWPAVMGDLFTDDEIKSLKGVLEKEGVKGEIEIEVLEKYPNVMKNMEKRGIAVKREL
ncbi:MAG: radical SAM protein [Candidatus Omnitrophota bacterium]